MTSTDPLLVRVSTALSRFSAELGRDTIRFSISIPIDFARLGSIAFSASK